jgi:uncharacterized protein YndB with AHSA1/START domain
VLKKILIGLAAVLIFLVLLGLVLPKDFKIERSVVINKPRADVFAYLKPLKNADEWGPWQKMDPNQVKELKGAPDGTVGAIYAWKGNSEVGTGEQEITAIDENVRIDTELRFKEPFEDTSKASFLTEDAAEGATKVTWVMEGRNGFPLNLLCFLMNMKGMLEKQFDEGLNALKAKAEGR